MTIPFRHAVEGTTGTITVAGDAMTVRIPAGVKDGQTIRLRGKGRPGAGGGPNGDLLVKVSVTPHPVFSRSGNDIKVNVPVTIPEAVLGATVTVPTLDGGTVKVKVPAGTPSGRTLRVKGRGVKTPKAVGDLLATVQVAVPKNLDEDALRALSLFAKATEGDADPRAEMLAKQTLRQYDRLGLVVPTRTGGGGRRYSARDVALLREVQRLSQNEGVNLAGIQRIMALEAEVAALRSRLAELSEHLDSALSAAQRSRRVFAAGPTGDVEAVRAGQRPRRGRTGSGEVVLWRPHRRSSWTG